MWPELQPEEEWYQGSGQERYTEFTARKTGTYYFHVTNVQGRGSYILRVGFP